MFLIGGQFNIVAIFTNANIYASLFGFFQL